MAEVLRYAAFSSDPAGGNPAGVVLDARGLSDEEMLAIAAELGYSESAFLIDRGGGEYDIRYFSPLAEVPFCGHATIAAGVALAERGAPGRVVMHTVSGPVPVRTERDEAGVVKATLTSVAPSVAEFEPEVFEETLAALRWSEDDLDPALPPRIAYAGAYHPILGCTTREWLAELDYDFDRLGALMTAQDWTTVQLLWRESPTVFYARDPFPPGGVVEDPATGAAAAALGAYLRELALVDVPARVTVHQGVDLGRPSLLTVDIPADRPEIDVSGPAVQLR